MRKSKGSKAHRQRPSGAPKGTNKARDVMAMDRKTTRQAYEVREIVQKVPTRAEKLATNSTKMAETKATMPKRSNLPLR